MSVATTSSIYNHRSLQPTAPAAAHGSHGHAGGQSRLGEALEVVKVEYEHMSSELAQARAMRDDYENKVNTQINELNIIRQALYELEAQHGKVRQRYEDEIAHLRSEIHGLRQLAGNPANPGPAASSASGLHDRDRDRYDRERDRERGGERDSKRLKVSKEHFSPSLPPLQNGSALGSPRARAANGTGGIGALPLPPMPIPRGAASSSAQPQDHREPDDNHPFLDNVDLATVPPELKREGPDWFAVWNPKIRPKKLENLQLVHSLTHATVVCCVQFSADGRFLATGCNRSAQIFDVKTGRKTCVLVDDLGGTNGDLYIRSVRFSPDGRYLATGAEDRKIRIWDITKGQVIQVFTGHTQEIYSLDFSRDGRRIVSGSGDRTARVWDMEDGTSVVLTVDAEPHIPDAGVTSVAMSPDGRFVAAGSLDNIVRIWEASTGWLLERLRGHHDSVYSVVFTPDGRGVISGSLDRTLKYWDVTGLSAKAKIRKESGKEINFAEMSAPCTRDFVGHKDYVLSVAVSHDGQWIVSGSKDRGVQFWDRSGVVHAMLQGHKNSVISIDLNPTMDLLATGSGDSFARIWSYT
ncbi:Chromatin associated protein [Mycena chlorophos]|uniref:Chromatin associated protein n=1 Tax=Mycena chlorophos TaxID=658473 RepID=A0A8H6TM15_MYCCL|nr:Chromatin associated protein [Mycena chlorophos]